MRSCWSRRVAGQAEARLYASPPSGTDSRSNLPPAFMSALTFQIYIMLPAPREATDDLFPWWQETRVNRGEIREVADLYVARFEARLEKGLAEVRADMATLGADLRSEMAAQHADLIKWMFIFWAGTVIPLAGLAIALSRL